MIFTIKLKHYIGLSILSTSLLFSPSKMLAQECSNNSNSKGPPIYKNVDDFLNITKKILNNEMRKKIIPPNFYVQRIDLNTGEGINTQDFLKNIAEVYILNDRPFGKSDENPRNISAIIKIPIDKYRSLTFSEAHSASGKSFQIFGKMSIDETNQSKVLISISPQLIALISDHDNDGIEIYKGSTVIITNFYGVSFQGIVDLPNQINSYSIGARSGIQLVLKQVKKIDSPVPHIKIGLDGGMAQNKEGIVPAFNPFVVFEVRM